MELSKVSKAIAGAAAAAIAALLLKYQVVLPAEVNGAIAVVIDFVIAGVIGYVSVYWAPKNKK